MKRKHLIFKEKKHFTAKQILDAYVFFGHSSPITFENSGRHFSTIMVNFEDLQRRLEYYAATYGDDFTDVKIDGCEI